MRLPALRRKPEFEPNTTPTKWHNVRWDEKTGTYLLGIQVSPEHLDSLLHGDYCSGVQFVPMGDTLTLFLYRNPDQPFQAYNQ